MVSLYNGIFWSPKDIRKRYQKDLSGKPCMQCENKNPSCMPKKMLDKLLLWKKSDHEGFFNWPDEFKIIFSVQTRYKVHVLPINLLNEWSN